MSKMNPVVHFEMPAQDKNRMVKKSIKKVAEAGGKVLGEPMEIPGVGQYVPFTDTEGNRVSMLQPIPRNCHAPKSK